MLNECVRNIPGEMKYFQKRGVGRKMIFTLIFKPVDFLDDCNVL
jgi:hypothetical protein